MKTSLLSLTIGFVATSSFAQTLKEEFKVLSQKGSNIHNTKPLATGTKLSASDKLSVGNGGYIGLLHKSGKTLELKQSGTYSVADLSQKVSSINVSTSKKYADFILGELTKADDDINKNHKQNMATTGSVERAIKEKLPLQIPILKDEKVHASDHALFLVWKNLGQGKIYSVSITNEFDEPVLVKETTDTLLNITTEELSKIKENNIHVIVKEKGQSSESEKRELVLNRNPELKENIKELNANLSENNSLNYFLKATFYRENKIFDQANSYFLKAINADPEVLDYKEAYHDFLLEYGLITK